MSFKNGIVLALALLLATQIVGCDRFLKSSRSEAEKAGKDKVKIQVQGLTCLEKLPLHLKDYFQDQASEADVLSAHGCLSESLKTFALLTKGSRPDAYTAEELRHFLNRYLLKETQISPSLMKGAMKIKSLVIGGPNELITRTEMDQLLVFLESVKREALALRGSMRFLLFQGQTHLSEAEFTNTVEKGRKALLQLFNESKIGGSVYELADLFQFMRELRTFSGLEDSMQALFRWVPLVESLKDLFFGSHSKMMTTREWQKALNWTIQLYALALDGFYNIRDVDFTQHRDWKVLLRLMDQGLALVESSPVFEVDGRLETKSLDRVIDEIWNLKLFETVLTPETVKVSYRMAILRFLDRNTSPQARAAEVLGLDRKHFSILKLEYRIWRLSQDWILSLYQDRSILDEISEAQLNESLSRHPISERIREQKSQGMEATDLASGWKEWQDLLLLPKSFRWTLTSKLRFPLDAQPAASSFSGLSMSNTARTWARFVLRGYGEGSGLQFWQLQIAEDSFARLEDDFRDFGTAIRFLDPRSDQPARRTFKEANYFAPHGNGDTWLSSIELYEEISLMLSGGKTITDQVMDFAHEMKCETGQIDPLRKPILTESCFAALYRDSFATFFGGSDALIRYVKSLNETQWQDFYDNLMGLAQLKSRTAGTREYAEIRTANVILHYVESLMMVYDLNHNGRLELAEVRPAYPRFRQIIVDNNPLGTWLSEKAFLYILAYRQMPGIDLIFFDPEVKFRDVNRSQLLQVLAVLKKNAK